MNPSTARRLATRAATTAGQTPLRQARSTPPPGVAPQQQTLTICRPVENVLRACRDPEVLATLIGSAGEVRPGDTSGRLTWTLGEDTVVTRLATGPNHVAYRTQEARPAEIVRVEAWPEPRRGGAEVVVRLDLPAHVGQPLTRELGGGLLAFTMVYRLRALLQNGDLHGSSVRKP